MLLNMVGTRPVCFNKALFFQAVSSDLGPRPVDRRANRFDGSPRVALPHGKQKL
jgi:hypothetical protein